MTNNFKEELSSWLHELEMFNLFVTFNFNAYATLTSGRTALKRFHARIDRKLLGKHFNLCEKERRTLFIAFPEHLNSNLHYHALVRTSSVDFINHAPDIWKSIVPSGELYISGDVLEAKLSKQLPFLAGNDIAAASNYAVKECWRDTNFNEFVISHEFLPL